LPLDQLLLVNATARVELLRGRGVLVFMTVLASVWSMRARHRQVDHTTSFGVVVARRLPVRQPCVAHTRDVLVVEELLDPGTVERVGQAVVGQRPSRRREQLR